MSKNETAEAKGVREVTLLGFLKGLVRWILIVIFVFAALGGLILGKFIQAIVFCLIAFIWMPFFDKLLARTEKVHLSGGMEFLIMIVFLVVIWIVDLEKESKPVYPSDEKNMKEEVPQLFDINRISPCDLAPEAEIVPTEFVSEGTKEENRTCRQGYHTRSFAPEVLRLSITLYDTPQESQSEYNTLVSKEKESRGYTEGRKCMNTFKRNRTNDYR